MATTTNITYPESPSGYWLVSLKATWEDKGFLFKPSHEGVTMDEATLTRALAAKKVSNVVVAA